MISRKEPNRCGKWGGEVGRIQTLDNLECQEEFVFDPIDKALFYQPNIS